MTQEEQQKHDELMQSCTALSAVHQLLSQGLFQGFNATEVAKSLNFIQALHKQAYSELEPLIEKKSQVKTQEVASNE
jgi:hypothetical protein